MQCCTNQWFIYRPY